MRLAVADAGPGALASGRSAALLWGVRVGPPAVEIHRPGSASLPGMIATTRHDIAVVDASTMLLQLVRHRSPADVATTATAVGVALDELSRRATQWVTEFGPHTRDVRKLVEHLDGVAQPDSGLETRFLQVLDRAALRRHAEFHFRIVLGDGPTLEVDIAFPTQKVVVELDGWAYHRSRESFGRDRSRDVELAGLGWIVLRFTHADIERRPAWVVEQLRRTLKLRSGRDATGPGTESP